MRYKSIILNLFFISGLIFAQGKKIYISADLEGVVGAVTGEQLGSSRGSAGWGRRLF